jgi:alpha-amylase/alpha-mannosidase (GH57 family)
VVDVVNNYARISFNVGPTLLSWMEDHARRTYAAILEADEASRERFGGHGSAMAQVYAHPILPLASQRDRATQVRWGVADFRQRFGREPEGMWLPETAADTASLEALADAGIAFTVLAPDQCASTRGPKDAAAVPTTTRGVDSRRAYRVELPSGRSIAVFFYDGPTSRAVAFEQLLHDGARFADRLIARLGEVGGLAHIATDGETYGHHHRHGEMALAWALDAFERGRGDVEIINYGWFLERHPPEWVATIHEPSAWSCAHGVGRWSRDCGCRSRAGSDQAWRGPLRTALEAMRRAVDPVFEREAGQLLRDHWQARDAYVDLVLDRARDRIAAFMNDHALRPLGPGEEVRALELLEMQRHAMLAFTSCGWFFDDVDGLEPTQILMYAARAIEIAESCGAGQLLTAFLRDLEAARSRHDGAPSARDVVERRVRIARFDASRVVAAHNVLALAGLAPGAPPGEWDVVETGSPIAVSRGEVHMRAGTFRVRRLSTGEERRLRSAAVRTGSGFDLDVAVTDIDDPAWDDRVERLTAAIVAGRDAEAKNLLAEEMDVLFDGRHVTALDETAAIAERVVAAEVERAEAAHRAVFERCAPVLRTLAAIGVPPPHALRNASKVVLDADLARAAESDPPDVTRMARVLAEARAEDVHIDQSVLALNVQRLVARCASALEADPDDLDRLRRLTQLVELARTLGTAVDVSRAQDFVWSIAREEGPVPAQRIAGASAEVRQAFRDLAEKARVRLPDGA